MARRLLDAGHEVAVWSRSADPAGLVAAGAVAASSPADAAARARVVVVMVADDAALADVTGGPAGVLAGVAADGAVLQASTVGPAAVRRLAAALPSGVELADAPVLGSVDEAAAGTLTLFVGGSDAVVERCEPVLAALGTPVRVGGVGAGTAAKLVANAALFGVLGVLGEALALARALGLPDGPAFEVLGRTPLAAQAERRRPSLERDDYPPRFLLSLAAKDADLVLGAADGHGVDLRLAPAVRSWFASAEAAGWAGLDYTAVLRAILAAAHPSPDREPSDTPPA
jgi:3-hydroxyisobutyrate dehydrogenase/2-hydroxy-3-oxopropionate reductase